MLLGGGGGSCLKAERTNLVACENHAHMQVYVTLSLWFEIV